MSPYHFTWRILVINNCLRRIILSAFSIFLFGTYLSCDASDDKIKLGNPEVDAVFATCMKEDQARATRYQQLLDAPYLCGTRLSKTPLPRRSPAEYRARFEKTIPEIYREASSDSAGVIGMCEFFILSCISINPNMTDQEKQKNLEFFLRK